MGGAVSTDASAVTSRQRIKPRGVEVCSWSQAELSLPESIDLLAMGCLVAILCGSADSSMISYWGVCHFNKKLTVDRHASALTPSSFQQRGRSLTNLHRSLVTDTAVTPLVRICVRVTSELW
jgi:hypothetical protein